MLQPKKFQNPLICLLNVELELKSEKDNAEVRIKDVAVSFNERSDVCQNSNWSHCSGLPSFC